jgi:hypothetical protein
LAERLTLLNKRYDKAFSNREKKVFQDSGSYLSNEFEAKQKIVAKSRANIGKLIHRQTGTTTYELVKTLKAGGKFLVQYCS